MVEPFANKRDCCEQDAWRIWRKGIQVGNQAPMLLLRHSAIVELIGAARLYRAASSDRRERG